MHKPMPCRLKPARRKGMSQNVSECPIPAGAAETKCPNVGYFPPDQVAGRVRKRRRGGLNLGGVVTLVTASGDPTQESSGRFHEPLDAQAHFKTLEGSV